MNRKTISKELSYSGVGLHKGETINLTLKPGNGQGIIFNRVDLDDGLINLDLENTFDLTRGTNLQNKAGAKVHTIEHFLSAVAALEITDLVVELDGNELPIGDGSAMPFIDLFGSCDIIELEEKITPIEIKEAVFLQSGDKHIVALPYDGFKISYTIKFDHSFLKSQYLEVDIDLESYINEVAKARTFGFDYEIEYLKANNLALGGTLDNAIVVSKDGVLNPDGLRFEDEFVRHKILDFIGDLKVLNRPLKGHFIAIKAGHALDIEFAKLLAKNY